MTLDVGRLLTNSSPLVLVASNAIFRNAATVQLDFMPAVVLTSASCPKGMEATVYSLLAGFQNFGTSANPMVNSRTHIVFFRLLVPPQ